MSKWLFPRMYDKMSFIKLFLPNDDDYISKLFQLHYYNRVHTDTTSVQDQNELCHRDEVNE